MSRERVAQVLCIGAGPANLSLAALAEPLQGVSVTVLEARDSVSWHPGLLWSHSRLQIHGLKDLVSLVDPRSEFTFVNFLHEEGRLYRHLTANRDYVSRAEFDQYFSWVASHLDVQLNTKVTSVEHDGSSFIVGTNRGYWQAETLVIGIGQIPHVPDCAREAIGAGVWHSVHHLRDGDPVEGKHVLLIGGGQSSAEVALDVLSGRTGLPKRLTWATGRGGLEPLDTSPFSDEWFTPSFVEYFNGMNAEGRAALLERQKPSYHGVNGDLLRLLYRRLYDLDFLTVSDFSHEILAGARLSSLTRRSGQVAALLRDELIGENRVVECDIAILGTGFKREIPDFLAPMLDRIVSDGPMWKVGEDYRVLWQGVEKGSIYAQNVAMNSHGVADANISLAAWRSAKILNSIVGFDRYRLVEQQIAHSLWEASD